MGQYTYLILDTASFLSVLIFSFMKPVYYYRSWKYLWKAIVITGAVFIAWDYFFTKAGVWEFNPEYVVGLNFLNLPAEEWLFFIVIPFACVFIYENVKKWLREGFFQKAKYIYAVLSIVLLIAVLLNLDKIYTVTAFTGAVIMLLIHFVIFKERFLGIFLIAYLIHLIPFFIINGVLTSEPVVIYNNADNLGIRLGTIPIEDTMYSLTLFLMNITIYEWIKLKGNK